MVLGITLLALIAGLVWLLRSPRRTTGDERDEELLEEAEREVRDLDASTTPEEAEDELKDWGPGVP